MKARTGARLALSLCGAALLLLALALVLILLGWPTALPQGFSPWSGQAFAVVGSLGPPILGATIARRQPSNSYGWLWCGLGLAAGVLALGEAFMAYSVARLGRPVASATLVLVGTMGWVGYVALGPFLMLLFPSGQLPSRRWRFVAGTAAATGGVLLFSVPFVPGDLGVAPVPNPLGASGALGEIVEGVAFSAVVVLIVSILLSALSLAFRFRQATGLERQQIKWFAYAAALVGAWVVFSGLLGKDLPGAWNNLLDTVSFSGLYVAVGIAILRHRLYDIDLIIHRTLVYGALTAVLALVYVGGVVGVGNILRVLTGQQNNNLVVAASTLAVAALFRPARASIQSFIDRSFYRRKYDAARTLDVFSTRLREEIDLESLSKELLVVVQDTMQPAQVSLWLREREGRTRQPA